jgi:hypothetical protein
MSMQSVVQTDILLHEFDLWLQCSYIPLEQRIKICELLESVYHIRISVSGVSNDWLDDGIVEYRGKLIDFCTIPGSKIFLEFSKIPPNRKNIFHDQVIAFLHRSHFSLQCEINSQTDFEI